MTLKKILEQGAEAVIFRKDCVVIKKRLRKSYRIKEIDDKIRKLRTRSEGKLLAKAFKIIPIPRLKTINEESKEITMDFIDGKKLSDHLNDFDLRKQKTVFRVIGESIAKLHDSNIIHGDLTTSNMILVEDKKSINKKLSKKRGDKKSLASGLGGRDKSQTSKVYFIDFGLGFQSHKIEDKAVDLHLLKQALEAKHFKTWEILFKEILKSYSTSKDSKKVLERLKAVEKRGRYKGKY